MRPPPIMVFIDNVRSGASIERLAAIDVESVQEIRWINARDATTRWGTGVAGGVIQVITRSPGGESA
jgi:outer membrane cobalamin receptor